MSRILPSELSVPLVKQRKVAFTLPKISFTQVYIFLSVFYLMFLAVSAIAPGLFTSYSPTEMNADRLLLAPSAAHWFGTDHFGRDMWTILLYGSRPSLLLGILSVLIGGIVGLIVGIISGYFGGWLDTLIMRLVDVIMTIPGTLLAIIIAVAIGPTFFNVVLAISIASIPSNVRIIRSTVISIVSRSYIDAARSIGTSHFHIMFRHILPGCISPLLVMSTIGIGMAILAGTGLSFLGLGVIKEIPDWGYILSEGRSYITVAWWVSVFPGIFITLLVVAFNLLGDELRDRLDPKHRRR